MNKRGFIFLFLATLCGPVWYFFAPETAGSDTSHVTSDVAEGRLREFIAASGSLQAETTVEVRTRVSGHLSELLVDFDDTVVEGQMIAKLHPRSHEARRAGASASLKIAKAGVALEKAEPERALAGLEPQKQALLELAEVRLQRTGIRAPLDGVFIKRSVPEGQRLASILETASLSGVAEDPSGMESHPRAIETDIGAVKIGQPVEFSANACPDRVFSEKLPQVRLAPEIVQNVVTYMVVTTTCNDARLIAPGMTARISILVMECEPVLRVPIAALEFLPETAPAGEVGSGSGGERDWGLGNDRNPKPVETSAGMRNRTHAAETAGPLNARASSPPVHSPRVLVAACLASRPVSERSRV